MLNNIKAVTRALATYTARETPSSRQLRNRIDSVTTALATLNDRQTNYENVADQVDAAEEEALLNPVIDAADAAIDDAEEKFDDIDCTPKPTPEVQSRLHTQDVENAYSHADSVVLGLQSLRAGGQDGEFNPKDCVHVKSELDLLKSI